jgi:hypothetical protein
MMHAFHRLDDVNLLLNTLIRLGKSMCCDINLLAKGNLLKFSGMNRQYFLSDITPFRSVTTSVYVRYGLIL